MMVRVLNLNIRGARHTSSSSKLDLLWAYLATVQANVAVLTETHITDSESIPWFLCTALHSFLISSHTCGVSVVPSCATKVTKLPGDLPAWPGHVLHCLVTTSSLSFTLTTVYTPAEVALHNALFLLPPSNVVVGDFNTPLAGDLPAVTVA